MLEASAALVPILAIAMTNVFNRFNVATKYRAASGCAPFAFWLLTEG
jgi:hypothetical protein